MNFQWENMILHWLHVMAMAVWVGGTIYMAFFLIPYMRKNVGAGLRIRVITEAGKKFGVAVWIALVVLILTGVRLLMERGITLESMQGSTYGRILLTKLLLVVAGVGLLLYHTYGIGAKIAEIAKTLPPDAKDSPPELRALVKRSALLSAVSFLVMLVITILGSLLAHG